MSKNLEEAKWGREPKWRRAWLRKGIALLLYTQSLIKSEFPHKQEDHGVYALGSCYDTFFIFIFLCLIAFIE